MLTTGKWRASIAYCVILALVVFAITFVIFDLDSIDEKERTDYSAVLQSFVYVLAILAAGAVAIYKLQVFRDLEPHLTIRHTITHRPIGDSCVHIFVTATLQNSSKVEVDIRREVFRVQQIAPASQEDVDLLVGAVFKAENQQDDAQKEIQWPTLDEVWRAWNPHEVIIEPGETHQETVEFVVSTEIESVLIYTYFFNPRFHQARSAQGWGATSVHDIV